MKKEIKRVGAAVCLLSVISACGNAFAAGYEVVSETDISYITETRFEDDGMYGEEITSYSNLMSNYSQGYSVVYEDCETYANSFVYYTSTDKQRIIDKSGNTVDIGDFDTIGTSGTLSGRTTYYSAQQFGNGVDRFGGVKVTKNEKHGYVGLADGVIIPCEYEDEIIRYEENLFGVGCYNPGQYGSANYFIDKDGNKLLDGKTFVYSGNGVFEEWIWGESVQIVYYDINGNKLENYTSENDLPEEYLEQTLMNENYVLSGMDGIFVTGSNGKFGIIDKLQNIVVPFIYDDICGAQGGYCWAAKDGKWLLLRVSTDEITVRVDDNVLEFDQIPLIINGRTLAPLRAIFEQLGATVEWDDKTKTITSTKGDTVIKMTIDKNEMYKNGEAITLDVAPQIVGERTLVPVRAISEAFDCDVTWDGENKIVSIKK